MPAAILLACNYRTLDNKEYATRSVLLGILATFFLFFIAAILPAGFPNMALPLAYTIGFREMARYLQGPDIERAEANGKKGSWLVVAGLGSVFLAGTLLFLVTLTYFGDVL